jgi:hypothetical protein
MLNGWIVWGLFFEPKKCHVDHKTINIPGVCSKKNHFETRLDKVCGNKLHHIASQWVSSLDRPQNWNSSCGSWWAFSDLVKIGDDSGPNPCWQCMYVCMHACMHVCMYVMYVMYVCMYVHLYLYLYLYLYLSLYMYMYMYVCTDARVYVCMYLGNYVVCLSVLYAYVCVMYIVTKRHEMFYFV